MKIAQFKTFKLLQLAMHTCRICVHYFVVINQNEIADVTFYDPTKIIIIIINLFSSNKDKLINKNNKSTHHSHGQPTARLQIKSNKIK